MTTYFKKIGITAGSVNKTYHSLDFASQLERIEPTKSGEYLVHLEDYTNINDLVRRSMKTHTDPFKDSHEPSDEFYDATDVDDEQLFEEQPSTMPNPVQQGVEASSAAPNAERSEAITGGTSLPLSPADTGKAE